MAEIFDNVSASCPSFGKLKIQSPLQKKIFKNETLQKNLGENIPYKKK